MIMEKPVVNSVSAVDKQIVRATLIIPLAITIICSTFDILFHIRLKMVEFTVLEEWMFWGLGLLISYFFPSLVATAGSLEWQYFFTDNFSGIKRGKGLLLSILTLIYFVLYIIYLLFADTIFIYVFTGINVLYVYVVLNKCIDEQVLKRSSTKPSNNVENYPV